MFDLKGALDFDMFKGLDKPDNHPLVKATKDRIVHLENRINNLASQKDIDIVNTMPDTVKNLFNEGVAKILFNANQEKDNRKKEEIYQTGLKAYPKNAYLLADYAGFLYNTGRAEEGAKKYQQTVTIKPDMHEAYYNWGTDLGKLAQTKTGDEADALYREAFEKYQQAVTIKPDYHEAYNNWGTDLGKLAQTKTGDEAEALYCEAFEKYQQAVTIKPDFHEAYNNWGLALGHLAQMKTGDEAEVLYQEAYEKYQKAIKLGGGYYNLACLYAVRSDRENAILYLEQCLANKEQTVDYVKQDKDWDAYRTDSDFLALLRRFE
jgi:tetratricopeptide (TPR) repeat protein